MKTTKVFLGICLIGTVLCLLSTGLVYCFLFYKSYDSSLVRNIYHLHSGMFLVFAFTLICISQKTTSIQTKDILWGVYGTLLLTLTWEVVYQGTHRYHLGQGFMIQWDQVLSDTLGVAVASTVWLIKRRRFLPKNKNLFYYINRLI